MLRPLLCLLLLLASCSPSREQALTLAAASSLRRVLPELLEAWPEPMPVRVSYGGSGTLRQQIEAGAPIDGALFAAAEPMDALIASGLVRADSRRVLARNELVLIGPADGDERWTFQTLPDLPPKAKLAIGHPATVPAGAYARDALRALGSWRGLQDRLVYGGDVAMVLAYARRGEVEAAVVYSTEVAGIDGVAVLDRAAFPAAPQPVVVGGVTAKAGEAAGRLLDFLGSPTALAILDRHGFGRP